MKETLIRFFVACSLFLLHPCAFSDTYTAWAYGVTETSGWYDYNKSWTTDSTTGDSNMCWAASASNLISWWQTWSTYASYADVSTPTGSNVYSTFVTSFTNSGGSVLYAWQWFFTGDYAPTNTDGWSQETDYTTGGGYYEDMFSNNNSFPSGGPGNSSSSLSSGSLSFCSSISSGAPGTDYLAYYISTSTSYNTTTYSSIYYYFSSTIVSYLENNYGISLSIINTSTSSGHAITLWGCEYEYDDDGNLIVTALYITDSDDSTTALQKVACSTSDDGYLYVTLDYYSSYKTWYVSEIIALSLIDAVTSSSNSLSVPEPSTSVLLFVVVLPLAMRRRRS